MPTRGVLIQHDAANDLAGIQHNVIIVLCGPRTAVVAGDLLEN
ncbi:MAG: hypothetical protein WBX78_19235 [Pseudolabrys sp.]